MKGGEASFRDAYRSMGLEPSKNGHENGHGGGEPKATTSPLLDGRVLLGKGMVEGIEPPEELEPGILLAGKVHQIYSGPASGKTILALYLTKRCIERGEKVVFFDTENGRRIVSERLVLLGVDPAKVDEYLIYFPAPNLQLTAESRAAYEALLDEVRPALIVFDSWINFLASAGLSENESVDIARWAVAFCHPARNRGIAVLLLDHVPHDNSHARGSTRKKDEADVQWRLHCTKPFDRDSVGEIVLHREKDREGWLPPSARFSVGGGKEGFLFRRSGGTLDEGFAPEAGAAGGLSANQRKILDVLAADFALTGATASEWQRATPGMSQATFYRALRAIKPRADLVVEREGRYHPVTPPSGDDDSGRDSEETRSNSGNTGNYHPLSNHYHPNGDSGGNLLSPAITLYKSDSGDSSVTAPLSAATVAAEFARSGSGAKINLPHFLRGDTTLEILTRSVLVGLGRDPERWQDYAPLVDGAARDGRNHPDGCPCPLCADVEVF